MYHELFTSKIVLLFIFSIVLQQINGKPVDGRDFEFEITDDNTLFDADNDLIANGEVAYLP